MKQFDFEVSIEAKAFRVEAETEEEAKCIVYDACKNHEFLVIEKIFSEVIDEKDV
jgi:hypothetical protein